MTKLLVGRDDNMANLILDSLQIRNFRVFRDLSINRLERVNLIVGKNNVGKTCVLEALRLFANRGSPDVLWDILEARDEGGHNLSRNTDDIEQSLALKYLFHGRRDITEIPDPISIGSVHSQKDLLSIALGWYTRQVNEQGTGEFKLLQPKEYDTADSPVLRLTVQVDKQPISSYTITPDFRRRSPRPVSQAIKCIFIGASGLENMQISRLWDSIALLDLEGDVLAGLRIIAPDVERLSIIGDEEVRAGIGRRLERIPIVKTSSSEAPIPIKSLGEGMNRMLGLALALVNTRNGMLLVDEIESGLHYSAQTDMWRLVFQVAQRLNVQVFATTHSLDCIKSFEKAAQEDTNQEGLLIRLGHKNENIIPTLFDEEELAIVAREQIEVR